MHVMLIMKIKVKYKCVLILPFVAHLSNILSSNEIIGSQQMLISYEDDWDWKNCFSFLLEYF